MNAWLVKSTYIFTYVGSLLVKAAIVVEESLLHVLVVLIALNDNHVMQKVCVH